MTSFHDYKFMFLLGGQLLFIFCYPLVQTTFFEWLIHPALALLILAVVTISTSHPVVAQINFLSLLSLVLLYTCDYLLYFVGGWEFAQFPLLYFAVITTIYLYFSGSLMFHLVMDKEARIDTLAGCASVFILIGLTGSYLLQNLSHISPEAFKILHHPGQNDFMSFLFFSLGSLTGTSANPEITPISSMARSLILLESILGKLYMALVTARIVGLSTKRTALFTAE